MNETPEPKKVVSKEESNREAISTIQWIIDKFNQYANNEAVENGTEQNSYIDRAMQLGSDITEKISELSNDAALSVNAFVAHMSEKVEAGEEVVIEFLENSKVKLEAGYKVASEYLQQLSDNLPEGSAYAASYVAAAGLMASGGYAAYAAYTATQTAAASVAAAPLIDAALSSVAPGIAVQAGSTMNYLYVAAAVAGAIYLFGGPGGDDRMRRDLNRRERGWVPPQDATAYPNGRGYDNRSHNYR